MDHTKKIEWMAMWAVKNKMMLNLEGECGFGRECVGVTAHDQYPDYRWYAQDSFDRIDKNGDVWIPTDAYHKHPCVAVLGRGEVAEAQLFDWLWWFDTNGFVVETGVRPSRNMSPIELLFTPGTYVRMVKKS